LSNFGLNFTTFYVYIPKNFCAAKAVKPVRSTATLNVVGGLGVQGGKGSDFVIQAPFLL